MCAIWEIIVPRWGPPQLPAKLEKEPLAQWLSGKNRGIFSDKQLPL